ncbi:MAG: hypothetical protein O6765_01310, partial [Gammaproteobacteria bacterium]|nr:hypothetical protein [Gammaproteobacteria bacterium]
TWTAFAGYSTKCACRVLMVALGIACQHIEPFGSVGIQRIHTPGWFIDPLWWAAVGNLTDDRC